MGKCKNHYIEGYPSLAAFIASDPDKTTFIFKRFNRLAARNLLHLQSELAKLEAKQDDLDRQASEEDLQSKQCLRNWEDFSCAAILDSRQKERLELALKIQKTLKDYREALIFESTLARLPEPNNKTLKAFRRRFFNGGSKDDHAFPILGGHSSHLLDDADDLVALKVEEEQDRLTVFVQNHLAFLFQVGLKEHSQNVPVVVANHETGWSM